jgi:hypothetical protein
MKIGVGSRRGSTLWAGRNLAVDANGRFDLETAMSYAQHL